VENDKPTLRQVNAKTPEEIEELRKQRKNISSNSKKRTAESIIETKIKAISKIVEKGEFYNINDPVEKAELEELGIYARVHKILIEASVKWEFLRACNFVEDEEDFTLSYGKKVGF